MVFEPLIETCEEHGHHFAKLPDHPKNSMGHAMCPYCLAQGNKRLWEKYEFLMKWLSEGRDRKEIMPEGHIKHYSIHEIDYIIQGLIKK